MPRLKKRWTPQLGYQGLIISDGRARTLREQIAFDDQVTWAMRDMHSKPLLYKTETSRHALQILYSYIKNVAGFLYKI